MEKTDTVVLENLHLRTVNAKLVEALERLLYEFFEGDRIYYSGANDTTDNNIVADKLDLAREALKLAKGE